MICIRNYVIIVQNNVYKVTKFITSTSITLKKQNNIVAKFKITIAMTKKKKFFFCKILYK